MALTRSDIEASTEELKRFYEELHGVGLGALWTSTPPANRVGVRNSEPKPHAVPYVWHWRDLRPRALQAAATRPRSSARISLIEAKRLSG